MQATCSIGHESLVITTEQGLWPVDYADLLDMRLLGYRLILTTNGGDVVFSELGHDTEPFFEKLWLAFMKRSQEALFVESAPLYSGEGDYAFTEQGITQHGIAKVTLVDDALVVCPHDRYARRIPLCFTQEPAEEPFAITLTLDTGDTYTIRRLGRDTAAVFEQICSLRDRVTKQWRQSHRDLQRDIAQRLGERGSNYELMLDCGCKMLTGLYRLGGEGFWFAGLKDGRAAVELVTEEQTATYLYKYDGGDSAFETSLRHAMESVGLHREVIFTELREKPLYRMTVERSYHLRFLREHNQGRVIHNTAWEKAVAAFFG